jgi:hypothetical protein
MGTFKEAWELEWHAGAGTVAVVEASVHGND